MCRLASDHFSVTGNSKTIANRSRAVQGGKGVSSSFSSRSAQLEQPCNGWLLEVPSRSPSTHHACASPTSNCIALQPPRIACIGNCIVQIPNSLHKASSKSRVSQQPTGNSERVSGQSKTVILVERVVVVAVAHSTFLCYLLH